MDGNIEKPKKSYPKPDEKRCAELLVKLASLEKQRTNIPGEKDKANKDDIEKYQKEYDAFHQEFQKICSEIILYFGYEELKLREEPSNKQQMDNIIESEELIEQFKEETKEIEDSYSARDGSYDMIIHINSLLQLNDTGDRKKQPKCGWPIQIFKPKLDYDPITLGDTSLHWIGIIGFSCRGKTHILNTFLNRTFPEGHDKFTQGISIAYDKRQKNIFLDSAGLETPIQFFKDEKSYLAPDEQYLMINDRSLTESFIQDFIVDVTNFLIVVVGQLTYAEQTLLKKLKERHNDKFLIIIHNYYELIDVASVQAKIQSDIFDTFDINSTVKANDKIDVTRVQEYHETNEFAKTQNTTDTTHHSIVHLVLARDGSDAGNKYNIFAYQYLHKFLFARLACMQKQDIEEKLIKFTQKNLCSFITPENKQYDMDIRCIQEFSKDSKECKIGELLQEKRLYLPGLEKYQLRPAQFSAVEGMILNDYGEPDYAVIHLQDRVVIYIECPFLKRANAAPAPKPDPSDNVRYAEVFLEFGTKEDADEKNPKVGEYNKNFMTAEATNNIIKKTLFFGSTTLRIRIDVCNDLNYSYNRYKEPLDRKQPPKYTDFKDGIYTITYYKIYHKQN
jgi:hypothetical protein